MSVKSRINKITEELAPQLDFCEVCRGVQQNVIIESGEPDPPACPGCNKRPFIIEVVRPVAETPANVD